MSHPFSKAELERYSRHLIIPEFNIEGQRKLKEAKVLVVGSGGLGSPLLLYLAAAGVGHIGIVDFDVIEDHNLQRQVLFGVDQVGQSKAASAKAELLSGAIKAAPGQGPFKLGVAGGIPIRAPLKFAAGFIKMKGFVPLGDLFF